MEHFSGDKKKSGHQSRDCPMYNFLYSTCLKRNYSVHPYTIKQIYLDSNTILFLGTEFDIFSLFAFCFHF